MFGKKQLKGSPAQAAEVAAAVEAERIRIASYLHDGVVQNLAATAIALRTAASQFENQRGRW
jgi:signal transduction histidine kinase